MRISEITEEKITDEIVDRVLFEGIQDKGENADCIVVLGSSKAVQYRVPADAIICEKNSENTIENFLFAMVELQRAILETANIIRCVKNGVFPDFEI